MSERTWTILQHKRKCRSATRRFTKSCGKFRANPLFFYTDSHFWCTDEQILESRLSEGDYSDQRSNEWSNIICEDTIEQLTMLNKPFKYIGMMVDGLSMLSTLISKRMFLCLYTVNCVLMQKNGAGLNSSTSCFWDTGNDGVLTIQWPKSNAKTVSNPTVTAVVTVFGIKLSE